MPSHNGDGNALGELGAYEDFAVAEDRSAVRAQPGKPGIFQGSLAAQCTVLVPCCHRRVDRRLGSISGDPPSPPGVDNAPTTARKEFEYNFNNGVYEVVTDNQTTAQSRSVAGLVIRNLGLRQSVDSFLSSYSATSVTDRVLVITVSASSSDQAVLRANAIAEAFLQVRADELLSEQELTRGSLEQQIGQVEQNISSLARQISRLAAEPASPGQQSQLSSLRAEALRRPAR